MSRVLNVRASVTQPPSSEPGVTTVSNPAYRRTYYRLRTSATDYNPQIFSGEYDSENNQVFTNSDRTNTVSVGPNAGQARLFDSSQWDEPRVVYEPARLRVCYGTFECAGFTQPAAGGTVDINFDRIDDPYSLDDVTQARVGFYGLDSAGNGGAYEILAGATNGTATIRAMATSKGSFSSPPGTVIGPFRAYFCQGIDYPSINHTNAEAAAAAWSATWAVIKFEYAGSAAISAAQSPQSLEDTILLADGMVKFAFSPQPLHLDGSGKKLAENGSLYIYNPVDFPALLLHALVSQGPNVLFQLTDGTGGLGTYQEGVMQNLGTQIRVPGSAVPLTATNDPNAPAGQAYVGLEPKHVFASISFFTGVASLG